MPKLNQRLFFYRIIPNKDIDRTANSKTLIRLLICGQSDVGLHCLTIHNCPKSWELISWQFLLVIVLSFTTIDEDSDYYNKKKWVHTL